MVVDPVVQPLRVVLRHLLFERFELVHRSVDLGRCGGWSYRLWWGRYHLWLWRLVVYEEVLRLPLLLRRNLFQ